jgi:undecaprenyl-diphosphatase
MDILETLILGLVQGLTEFIPVSSSGHLVLAQQLLEGASDHLFIEFINLGTLLALLVFFRKRIVGILNDIFVKKDFMLARNIIVTALPAGIIGFFLSDFIATSSFFGNVAVVATALATVGVIMIVLEKLPKASEIKDGRSLSVGRALIVGLAQTAALIPGVSRSGSTIIAGRLTGLKPAAAAEYSFLVSLPIMVGVTAKLFIKAGDRAYFFDHLPVLLLSNTVAFVAGLVAVGFLMRYLATHSLAVFGWYRLGLAAMLVVILLVQ